MTELNYSVDSEGSGITLSLVGDLDMSVATSLRAILEEQLASRPAAFRVDLAKVPFIDSSIIATLVGSLKIARQQDTRLTVLNCQSAVRDTFEITRLLESFGID